MIEEVAPGVQGEADQTAYHRTVDPYELEVATDMRLEGIGERSGVPVTDRVGDERSDIVAMSAREIADYRAQATIDRVAHGLLFKKVVGEPAQETLDEAANATVGGQAVAANSRPRLDPSGLEARCDLRVGHRLAEPGLETCLKERILSQVGGEPARHKADSIAHRMGGIAGDVSQKVFKGEDERIGRAVVETDEPPDPPGPLADL